MTLSGISDRDSGKGTSNILERLSYSEKYLSEAFKYMFQEKKMHQGQDQTQLRIN